MRFHAPPSIPSILWRQTSTTQALRLPSKRMKRCQPTTLPSRTWYWRMFYFFYVYFYVFHQIFRCYNIIHSKFLPGLNFLFIYLLKSFSSFLYFYITFPSKCQVPRSCLVYVNWPFAASLFSYVLKFFSLDPYIFIPSCFVFFPYVSSSFFPPLIPFLYNLAHSHLLLNHSFFFFL